MKPCKPRWGAKLLCTHSYDSGCLRAPFATSHPKPSASLSSKWMGSCFSRPHTQNIERDLSHQSLFSRTKNVFKKKKQTTKISDSYKRACKKRHKCLHPLPQLKEKGNVSQGLVVSRAALVDFVHCSNPSNPLASWDEEEISVCCLQGSVHRLCFPSSLLAFLLPPSAPLHATPATGGEPPCSSNMSHLGWNMW